MYAVHQHFILYLSSFKQRQQRMCDCSHIIIACWHRCFDCQSRWNYGEDWLLNYWWHEKNSSTPHQNTTSNGYIFSRAFGGKNGIDRTRRANTYFVSHTIFYLSLSIFVGLRSLAFWFFSIRCFYIDGIHLVKDYVLL